MRRLFSTLFAVLAIAVCLAPATEAQIRPITVKLMGTAYEAPTEGRPRAKWHLRVNRKEVPFFLTKLVVLAGSTTQIEIINRLKLSRGAIVVNGPKPALETLETAAPGTPLEIQGTLRWTDTPAILLVSTVGVAKASP